MFTDSHNHDKWDREDEKQRYPQANKNTTCERKTIRHFLPLKRQEITSEVISECKILSISPKSLSQVEPRVSGCSPNIPTAESLAHITTEAHENPACGANKITSSGPVKWLLGDLRTTFRLGDRDQPLWIEAEDGEMGGVASAGHSRSDGIQKSAQAVLCGSWRPRAW